MLSKADLPSFMASMGPDLSALETETGGFGGVAQTARLAGLEMWGQEEANWCWSAVTHTVMHHFGTRGHTQEAIATDHLTNSGRIVQCVPPERQKFNNASCADGGCLAYCNDPHILRLVLAEQGRLDRVLSSSRAPSFAEIRDEIDADRPLPCRVQWNAGGGHFIIVSGWTIDANGTERVHVLDPSANEAARAIGERVIDYAEFAARYTLSGNVGRINFSYRVR
jgi:hypothetical protein